MKSGWEKYAIEKRFVQKGYFRKYCDGGSGRKAYEASRCDSLQQSWKSKKEEVEELPKDNQYETERKEDSIETYQEGRQGISFSDKGRPETQEANFEIKNGEEEMKEKKHEAKEGKKYEKLEDKREKRKEAKEKKKSK